MGVGGRNRALIGGKHIIDYLVGSLWSLTVVLRKCAEKKEPTDSAVLFLLPFRSVHAIPISLKSIPRYSLLPAL